MERFIQSKGRCLLCFRFSQHALHNGYILIRFSILYVHYSRSSNMIQSSPDPIFRITPHSILCTVSLTKWGAKMQNTPTSKPAMSHLPADSTVTSLVQLRAHAYALHTRLSELADLLAMVRDGVGPARHAGPAVFLAQYETIGALSAQLARELSNSGLAAYDATPTPAAAGLEPGAVPEALRTLREPDAERDARALDAAFDADRARTPLKSRIVGHNKAVLALLDVVTDLAEEHALDPLVEPPRPRAPPAANAILAAITSGAGL